MLTSSAPHIPTFTPAQRAARPGLSHLPHPISLAVHAKHKHCPIGPPGLVEDRIVVAVRIQSSPARTAPLAREHHVVDRLVPVQHLDAVVAPDGDPLPPVGGDDQLAAVARAVRRAELGRVAALRPDEDAVGREEAVGRGAAGDGWVGGGGVCEGGGGAGGEGDGREGVRGGEDGQVARVQDVVAC
jgi:hypothetical protein